MVAVVTLVSGYVGGVARGIVEAVAEGETHEAEVAWWRARSAVLERAGAFDPDRLPVSTRIACPCRPGSGPRACSTGALTSPTTWRGEIRRTFEFGLQRVLDGIAVLVDARVAD
jgi:hypothetical protein